MRIRRAFPARTQIAIGIAIALAIAVLLWMRSLGSSLRELTGGLITVVALLWLAVSAERDRLEREARQKAWRAESDRHDEGKAQ